MKNILFVIALFTLAACSSDDEVTILNLDGPNQAAPELNAGTFEASVRFSSTEMERNKGKNLESIEFFIDQIPSSCQLVVYSGTTIIFTMDVSSVLRSQSWNTHLLETPIEITGEELWISVIPTHLAALRSIGCDAGPAVNNGDWFMNNTTSGWTSFRDFTDQAVDINWNIRGILSE